MPRLSEGVNGPDSPRPAVTLGRALGASGHTPDGRPRHTYRFVATLYVATPELVRYLGLDGLTVTPGVDVLTPHTGALRLLDFQKRTGPTTPPAAKIQAIDVPRYESAPTSLIPVDVVKAGGWTAAPAAWLVDAGAPLTDAQRTEARKLAVATGLSVEVRDRQAGLATTRTGATAAGVLLALGILAMTVGLIRGEGAADLRTLTAAGATSTLRRALTATTAGALALLGAVLGIAGAYAALIAGYLSRLSDLGNVPVRHLSVTAIGLPLVAAAAGWLLAGREPPSVARQPLLE